MYYITFNVALACALKGSKRKYEIVSYLFCSRAICDDDDGDGGGSGRL